LNLLDKTAFLLYVLSPRAPDKLTRYPYAMALTEKTATETSFVPAYVAGAPSAAAELKRYTYC
jgi:hypothetical protein